MNMQIFFHFKDLTIGYKMPPTSFKYDPQFICNAGFKFPHSTSANCLLDQYWLQTSSDCTSKHLKLRFGANTEKLLVMFKHIREVKMTKTHFVEGALRG